MESENALQGSPAEGHMEAQRPPRFWLVGLVMFGLIVVILVGAFLLNRQFRPRVGIEPVATPVISTQVQATAVPAVVSQPTVQPAASPTVAVTPSAAPTQAPSGAVPAGKPTADPTLTKEVEQAYLKYWQVYSDALLNLDTTRLPQVAADKGLSRIEEEIANLRNEKLALRVRVSHSYIIFDVTDSEAKVYDEIFDRSFTVDPVTKNPPDAPVKGGLVKDIFFMQKIGGTWKVVEHLRQEG